ncbi:glycoside hydrolase family 27 protein, partial [Streptomyces albidoflavus]
MSSYIPSGFARSRVSLPTLTAVAALVCSMAGVQIGAAPQARAATLADEVATPPMGWNTWNSFHCNISEQLIKASADRIVSSGMKAAGYEYVVVDDCWMANQRDANGKLQADPNRFGSGMKALGDYLHARGLKFGIYQSPTDKTCEQRLHNRPGTGSEGFERKDAETFAEWGVDYLKYDNCNHQGVDAKKRYTTMRDALKATGRPIVFSICEWGENRPWEWAADVGHLWRTTGDINDSWGSTLSIMKKNLPLHAYAGPGNWNDPDMLEVGNGGMTDTEYRTQFSMWSIMAAPLLIGTDLRKADDATFEILSNREVIAVDQDPLGRQGEVISSEAGRWVVVKELSDGSRAIALFNESDRPQRIETSATDAGLPRARDYRVRDLWAHSDASSAGTIAATVPAHGTVLLRVSPERRWES